MDYQFWIYVFTSAVFSAGGAFYFYRQNQEVTSVLFFLGALAASIFFGFRWYSPSGAAAKKPAGAWPPVINYCPDFMTLMNINGEQVCVDTVGIAQPGGISMWSDATQTDERYLFHLFLQLSGSDRVKQLCKQASAKMVTWEGVWDGAACMGKEPPMPPQTAASY